MMDEIRLVVTGSFVVLALIGLRLWWQHRTRPSLWLTGMFLSLGVARLAGVLIPEEPNGAVAVVDAVVPAITVAFPYLLFRFADSFEPLPRRWRILGDAVGALMVLATLGVMLGSPEPTEASWYGFFVLAAVGGWTAFTAWAAWRLWSRGRSQPTLARRRLWTMASAAALLNVALLLAGLGQGESAATTGELVALASALAFVLAFVPPRWVRALWRRADEHALWEAEGDLVRTSTRTDVVSRVLPYVTRLLGGHGAIFVDRRGTESLVGLDAAGAGELRGAVLAASDTPGGLRLTERAALLTMREGRLGVATSPYTPMFGRDELDLIERLGALIDLALDRADLYERVVDAHTRAEEARARAEASSAELETLLYGISHDLRTPIVSMRGYVDCLTEDHAAALDAEGRHFLTRLQRNAQYMDQLVSDLLELSRAGSSPPGEPSPVALGPLLAQIADELSARRPGARVEVEAGLPEVRLAASRARQLFTNLLLNAVHHCGRPDVHVQVRALGPGEDGRARISVRDNGRGIPASAHERVFEIFERLTGSPDGDSPGSGIGLAISRRIVEEAGGRIWVADTDSGADVRVELPLALRASGTHDDDC